MTAPADAKWQKIAYAGSFAHPSGRFSMDSRTFDEVVRNFRREQMPIVVDFEHSSEAAASDGSVPQTGAPAAGWIHDLDNRGAGGLWALVEWLEPAKSYIKERKYISVSPVMQFGAKDRNSGDPVGCRLRSLALTNQPFLNLLPAIAAKDTAHTAVEMVLGPDGVARGELTVPMRANFAHGPHEYMPGIKAALRMPELSSARECSDQLDRLRGHFDASDGDPSATPEGIKLGDYLMGLRTCVAAQPGTTWEQVFDVVQDLLDAAIDQHVIEDHGGVTEDGGDDDSEPDMTATLDDEGDSGAAAMRDAPSTEKERTMATQNANDESVKQLKDLEASNAVVTAKLKDAETQVSTLTLKLTESTTRATQLETENKALKDAATARAEKDLEAEVEAAFLTYKDRPAPGALTDAHKPHMLRLCKADPEAFRAMYPVVAANERHLQRQVVPMRDPQAVTRFGDDDGAATKINLADLAEQIADQKGIPLAEAQIIATRMGENAKKRVA